LIHIKSWVFEVVKIDLMVQTASLFKATAMPDRDWWQALWPDPVRVLREIGIESGMTVVDLCCGDGYFTAPLSKLVDGHVYGVDIDSAMLDRTRREIQRQGAPACSLLEADALDLPTVIREKVDYVLIANTFHGVPDKTALARKVADVLKVGGVFGIINWYPKPREDTPVLGKPRGPSTELRMSPEDTLKVVEPAGFKLDKVVKFPPYHYAAIFERS